MSARGLIVIDKAKGLTSRKVTTIVSKIFSEKRAGHLGTLDPLATGVLPILLGTATRLASFLESDEKIYLAKIKLGQATDTMDAEGTVISENSVPPLSREQIISVLEKFSGEIEQKPPMFSAVKHQGERLYQLARRGETVEVAPRKIKIFEISLENFDGSELELKVRCSPGTYIRVLADEIGKTLGCGAHLSALRRLKAEKFSLDISVELDQLTLENCSNYLTPLEQILDFETIEITDEAGFEIRDGKTIPLGDVVVKAQNPGILVQVLSKPCFAICELVEKDSLLFLKPLKVFAPEEI
jgi:tRNA pseudouridine55 synthase